MSALLEAQGVTKHFGGVAAVEDFSMEVPSHSVTGLIGPNGAGKSTLIEMISGSIAPDSGIIRFDGLEIQGLPAHRVSRYGLLRTFQLAREWPGLTVLENVMVAALSPGEVGLARSVLRPRRTRASSEDAIRRGREALDEFGLLHLEDELAGRLSGGQKRLLEFARLVLASPKLVLLDEPFAGVNPVMGAAVQDAIRRLVDRGIAVLLVEHDLEIIEALCSKIVVMAMGHQIAEGTMSILRSDSAVLEAYLGA